MGSEADVRYGDAVRRAVLAVRNVGWQGGSVVGRDAWDRLVDDLVAAVKKEPACASTS